MSSASSPPCVNPCLCFLFPLPPLTQAIGNGELYEQHQQLVEARKELADQDAVRHASCIVFNSI